jgi:hypothetical protein
VVPDSGDLAEVLAELDDHDVARLDEGGIRVG